MPLTTKDALLERMADATSALKDNITMLAPAGCVMAFAGNTVPDGWLPCDGSAISRTDYAALFAVVGTTYGSGDGSTTFNVPNLIDKFVEGGSTAGTVKNAGLPNITGSLGYIRFSSSSYTESGALSVGGSEITVSSSGSGTAKSVVNFDASASSSIYGNSTTVQPPAIAMKYIIKY